MIARPPASYGTFLPLLVPGDSKSRDWLEPQNMKLTNIKKRRCLSIKIFTK